MVAQVWRRLIVVVASVGVVAAAGVSPASAAPDERLTIRDRTQIAKAINAYVGNGAKSRSNCWAYTRAQFLENGVKTARAVPKPSRVNSPSCSAALDISKRQPASVPMQFSPGAGWTVMLATAKEYTSFRPNGHSLLPVGRGGGLFSPGLDQTVLGVYNGADGSPAEVLNSNTRGTYTVSTGENVATSADSGRGVQLAHAIPATCDSATFRVTGSFTTNRPTSAYNLAMQAATLESVLGNQSMPVSVDASTTPNRGAFASELTVAASNTLVKFSAGVDNSAASNQEFRASVDVHCYALPTDEDRITWSKVDPKRPAAFANLQVRVFGRYTDGSWLPLAQGTRVYVGDGMARELLPTTATYDWEPADTDLDLSYIENVEGVLRLREFTLAGATTLVVSVPFGGHSQRLTKQGGVYIW